MLSKPGLMSRKRVGTFSLDLWSVLISWVRVRHAWEELRPGRDPHSLGRSRSLDRAMADSVTIITRTRIFDIVLRRSMIQEEEGES